MSSTKTIKESNWKNYLIKAEQFWVSCQDAYIRENWNAVGLNAVHTVISANNALTVYYHKTRSGSAKHSDAVNLLLIACGDDSETKKMSRHLSWLINRKNLVEYKTRLFYKKEADEAMKHTERFLAWCRSKLPK